MTAYAQAAWLDTATDAVEREDYCHDCAPYPGLVYGDHECVGVSFLDAEDERESAPDEGIACCECAAEILPPMCSGPPARDGCGMREDQCICEEMYAEKNAPVRVGGEWVQ